MTKLEINTKLATYIGLDYTVDNDTVFAGIKREGNNLINVSGVIDFTSNWNLLMPIICSTAFNINYNPGLEVLTIQDTRINNVPPLDIPYHLAAYLAGELYAQ